MKIQRSESEAVETPKQTVDSLEGGTVFKVGKKLFLKTTGSGGYGEAVRLTTGDIQEFDADATADEVVEGTFNYE